MNMVVSAKQDCGTARAHEPSQQFCQIVCSFNCHIRMRAIADLRGGTSYQVVVEKICNLEVYRIEQEITSLIGEGTCTYHNETILAYGCRDQLLLTFTLTYHTYLPNSGCNLDIACAIVYHSLISVLCSAIESCQNHRSHFSSLAIAIGHGV